MMNNKILFKATKERLAELSKGQMTVSALIGAGLGMAFVSATDIDELDLTDLAIDTENTDQIDSEYIEVSVEISDMDDSSLSEMSFSEAFGIERNLQGPGGAFMYNGKLYNTFYEEEWNDLTDSDKGDYFASLDLRHSVNTLSYQSNDSEISIDNDSEAEIVIGDVNADGQPDIVEVDLNNDGNIDVIHTTQQNYATHGFSKAGEGNTDISFEATELSIDADVEYEVPVTYTHEAVDEVDNVLDFDQNNNDFVIDETSVADEIAIETGDMVDPSDMAIESGDMVDPSDMTMESGDMVDPSDIVIEAGDMVDPSEMAIEFGDMVDPSDMTMETGDMVDPSSRSVAIESGDMIDPSDMVLETGDMVDPSDLENTIDTENEIDDLGLDSGSTELGDEDVTGLDLSEFDF